MGPIRLRGIFSKSAWGLIKSSYKHGLYKAGWPKYSLLGAQPNCVLYGHKLLGLKSGLHGLYSGLPMYSLLGAQPYYVLSGHRLLGLKSGLHGLYSGLPMYSLLGAQPNYVLSGHKLLGLKSGQHGLYSGCTPSSPSTGCSGPNQATF